MKIKVRPDDFQVEELMRLRMDPRGKYLIYRLEKRLWNTLDVLDFVGRKYRLGNLQRAGLKDRYAHSIQYISAVGAGPKMIEEKNFRLRLMGRSATPVSLDAMIGNRFRIVLRDMTSDELAAVKVNLPRVLKHGFPNYYDEQRFGSARHGEGFIAHKLILGHYNGALKLYMATTSARDDSATRRMKSHFNEHWGDWEACLRTVQAEASTSSSSGRQANAEFAPILRYLAQHPKDFEGALGLIRRDFLEMFLNSYQSYLWNETLSQLIMSFGLKTDAVPYSGGELLFYRELNPKAREFFAGHEIPAASPTTESSSERIDRTLNTVLIREGLTLRDMKLDLRIPGVFFKPFYRSGVVVPQKPQASSAVLDDLYPDHRKMELSFTLPPGSYATILVKRLILGNAPSTVDKP